MQKIISLLSLILISVFSNAQYDLSLTEGQKGKWSYVDRYGVETIPVRYDKATSDTVPSGEYKKYYFSNNQLKAEGTEVNGKREGSWKFYYENGQLMQKDFYKNGKAEGDEVSYHPNGKFLGTVVYKNGNVIRIKDFFDNTGKITNYNGTGYVVFYHTNGALNSKIYYKNGSRDGEATWYHPNGQLDQKAIYKYSATDPLGLRWEVISSYDKYGVEREKGTLKNGTGSWISYDENDKSTTTYYVNGVGANADQLSKQNNSGEKSSDYLKAVDLVKNKSFKESFNLLQKVVADDPTDTAAMNLLAEEYFYGLGTNQDDNKAFEWWTKSANLGDPQAMNNIGNMYYNGWSVPVDFKKALEWYNKSAAKSFGFAMVSIGDMYRYGKGVQQNTNSAISWFQKAADNHESLGLVSIGEMYYFGEGVDKSFSTAMDWFEKAVDNGNAIAMRYLGYMYLNGESVKDDKMKAFDWFMRSANKSDDISMLQVGAMYYKGQGVGQSFGKALEWYIKSAENNNPTAMQNISYMYGRGEGVEKNMQTSLLWAQKAVDADSLNPEAYNRLGYVYFNLKNYDKAIETLRKALKINPKYANGYDSLGEFYEAYGEMTKAVIYYKKAAAMGVQNSIDWLKKNGISVPDN